MSLQEANKLIDDVEFIWEKALDEAVKSAVIPLESKIAELESSSVGFRELAEESAALSQVYLTQRNISLAGAAAFVVGFALALII